MADVQLKQLLQGLEGAATPDPAFSDSLYERVVPLAMAAGRRDRTWYGRIIATLRSRSIVLFPTVDPRVRTMVLGMALLLLALALAIVIGSQRPDPNQLVLRSEAFYRDPPAFDMSVSYSDGASRRFRYDGTSMFRLDVLEGSYRLRPTGSYLIADANQGRIDEWDPVGRTTTVTELPAKYRGLTLLDLRWGADLQVSGRFSTPCLDWEYVEETIVTLRPVHHVKCTTGRGEEYWVDVATGFVLQSTDVPTDEEGVWLTGTVEHLEVGGVVDAAAFAMDDGPTSGGPMLGGDASFVPGVRVVTSRFAPAFAVIPGDGWRSWGTDRDVVGLVRGPDGSSGPDGGTLFVVKLSTVVDPASGRDVTLEPDADAAITWLRTHPYFETSEPEAVQVGTRAATSMAYQGVLPAGFESSCPRGDPSQPPPPCLRMFKAGTGYWTYDGANQAEQRATFFEVNGTTLMILTSADGPDIDAHRAAIEDLLASIEFLD